MCSNTGSTSACGCSSGGNGGSIWSSSLKKQQQQHQQQQQQKRPRIPKRGPGVAELEKILREQETIDISTTTTTTDRDRGSNNEGFSSSCYIPHYSSSSSLKSHQQPPPLLTQPNSPSSGRTVVSNMSSHHVPSAPKFDHIVPPPKPPNIASMYGNSPSILGRSGGSGFVSQEVELFPMNHLTSCKSKSNFNEVVDGSQSDSGNSPSRNLSSESNHVWSSYPSSIQKRNNNGFTPPPMMNQFHGTNGTAACSGSLSIGLQNHLEPPSNQNSYYQYTSRSQEEPKIVGIKRSHTSSLDNSLIAPSNFQVLPSFSRYSRPNQSSTNDNHGAASFNPTNECYRDAKWGSTLELNSRRFNSENVGSGHANFPPFVAPEVPSPPSMHLFQSVLSKGNVLPSQVIEDKMESSYQRSESSGQDRKPFFNFLEVKGQEGVTDAMSGSNHGGREGGRGGIDLSLKL